MTHHEDLAEADRLIADCMDHIARQREVITTRYEQGFRPEPPGSPRREAMNPSAGEPCVLVTFPVP